MVLIETHVVPPAMHTTASNGILRCSMPFTTSSVDTGPTVLSSTQTYQRFVLELVHRP